MVSNGCHSLHRLCRSSLRKGTPESEPHTPLSQHIVDDVGGLAVDKIVMASSDMGDFVAPPWELINTHLGDTSQVLWEDPRGRPELTSRQKKRLAKWVRLTQQGRAMNFFSSTPCSERIKQGFVADCSFLSCLAALANYEKRCKAPLLTKIIQLVVVEGDDACLFGDHLCNTKERPLGVEPKIAIGVKLYFNGAARCMLVDDWVPVREDGRLLCARSTDTSELWVTVLEKAFLKINGGSYSIRGTNPGIDIYHLSGWIPDIITLPSLASTKPDNDMLESHYGRWDDIWDVIYAGFCSGSCVVCVGTGKLFDAIDVRMEYSEGISASSGIVSDHAYSVLDIKDAYISKGTRARLLYIKNPWGKVSWKKRFSSMDTESWTPEMQQLLNYKPEKDKDNGTFWMEWKDVLYWFSHLYVSWKPNVFRNRITLHHMWNANPLFLESDAPEDVYLSMFNPQFKVTVSLGNYNSATVWLMLLQHRKRGDEDLKYLAMHIFSKPGPVICPTLPDVQGVYNNGECILMKLLVKSSKPSTAPCKHMLTGDAFMAYETEEDTSFLIVNSHYHKKMVSDMPFTLRVLSTRPVTITPKPCVVKDNWHKLTITGKWDETNSGGSLNEQLNYFKNPHYRLFFEEDSEAIVLLESRDQLSLNLRIFQGRLATYRSLKQGNIISSDDYKTHCCGIHRIFKSGQYVLIPSTFKSTDRGDYRVVVHSAKACWMKPLPYPHAKIYNIPGIHVQTIESQKPVFIDVKVPTLASIRVEVPLGVMSDLYVLFASSYDAPHRSEKEFICSYLSDDNYFCLGLSCMYCGGPSGRFRALQYDDPQPDKEEFYDLILFSDMNGGNSKTGRTESAAAREVFQKRRAITFTLVELLPSKKPYKLSAVGVATAGTFTFVSEQPITIM
ncbi:calpain-7 [Babesia gibsoni]|uniref:Calpain-7 n=1 Tax=Babesia gibsoni TaxID=33632 RepID=A0AAD8PFF6_BABGI|nr:calpain-7 [Babesia gibsoni]